jgi:exodeoxyribonuclease VII small subunit
MTDESYNFTTARARLDEIVTQVRKKDMSLEASLDLLEEGVRLANQCTELIDHVDWAEAAASSEAAGDALLAEDEPHAASEEVSDAGGEETEPAENGEESPEA